MFFREQITDESWSPRRPMSYLIQKIRAADVQEGSVRLIATPVAPRSPDLGLVSEGFEACGHDELPWQRAWRARSSPPSGRPVGVGQIKAPAQVDSRHLGPLELKIGDLDVQVPFKTLHVVRNRAPCGSFSVSRTASNSAPRRRPSRSASATSWGPHSRPTSIWLIAHASIAIRAVVDR